MSLRPQPLLVVSDVDQSRQWYVEALGSRAGHGGVEYEQLLVDGTVVLQLHALTAAHHHGAIADPDIPVGNGVAVWFETDEFDAVVGRARGLGAEIVIDVHVNPNAGHRELWLRDPDGYLVVFAEAE